MNLWVEKQDFTRFWRRVGLFPPEHLEDEVKRVSADTVAQSFHKELAELFRKGVENGEVRNVPSEKLVALFQILIDGILTALVVKGNVDSNELVQDG